MVMVSRWRKNATKTSGKGHQAALSAPSASKVATACSRHSLSTLSEHTPVPSEMPVRNVFRDRLLALTLDEPHTDVSVRLPYGNRGSWIHQALDLPELRPALENILLAVSTAQLGQRTSRPELLHESLKLYTKGISGLRGDILDPAKRTNDQNLAACLGALVYEVTATPGASYNGYKAHYQGTLELLRLRGPSSHGAGLAHSVLSFVRVQAVCVSVPFPGELWLEADRALRSSTASYNMRRASSPMPSGSTTHGSNLRGRPLSTVSLTSCSVFPSFQPNDMPWRRLTRIHKIL